MTTSIRPIDASMLNINIQQPQSQSSSVLLTKIKSLALRLGPLLSYLGNAIITYLVMYHKNLAKAQKYFLYVTPAAPFFKIWIIIYALLLFVVLQNLWKNVWGTKSTIIFIISNCLTMISSGLWSIGNVYFFTLSGLVLASVDNVTIWFWRVLIDEYMESEKNNLSSENQTQITAVSVQSQSLPPSNLNRRKQQVIMYSKIQLLIVRNVITFYIGLITVTGTVILGLVSVYWWGLTKCQQFIIFWITTPIAGTALYLFLALKMQNQYKYCFGYILSVVYGIIGASIASINNITQRNYC